MWHVTVFYFAYHTGRQYREKSLVSFFMSIFSSIFSAHKGVRSHLGESPLPFTNKSIQAGKRFFCPNKHMYKIMTSKIFVFDLNNVGKYIFGYISPTFTTPTYDV